MSGRREGRRFLLEFCLVLIRSWISILSWFEREIRMALADG